MTIFLIRCLSALAMAFCLFCGGASSAVGEPLKVGISLCLTGSFAEFGEAIRNGLQMAQEMDRARFANIKFIFEDDRYEPKLAVGNFHKLRTVDKVDIVYVWGTEPTLAVAPLADRYQLPVLAGSLDPRSSAGYTYAVRTYPEFSKYGEKMRAHLEKVGVRRAAAFIVDLSFFHGMSSNLKGGGFDLTTFDPVTPEENRFELFASKFRAADYDALGVYLGTAQIIEVARQFEALRLRPKVIFGATHFYNLKLLEVTNGFYEGTFFPHLIASREFEQRYLQRFGSESQLVYAASAYDTANLLADLFGNGRNNRPVLEQILSLEGRPLKGANGSFTMKRDPQKGAYLDLPVGVYQVQRGRPVLIEPSLTDPVP